MRRHACAALFEAFPVWKTDIASLDVYDKFLGHRAPGLEALYQKESCSRLADPASAA